MNPRRWISMIALTAIALAVAGCVQSGGATSDASDASDPSDGVAAVPVAQPSDGPCFNNRVEGDYPPQTIAIESSISPVILVGTFRGRGTAFWVSPDGSAPGNIDQARKSAIMTRVTIATDTLVRGDIMNTIQAVVAGGVIGCSSETRNAPMKLDPNARYIFFGTNPDPDRAPKEFVLVYAAWPMDASDRVTTPANGVLPLADVLKEIASYPVLGPDDTLPYPTQDPTVPGPSEDNLP